jgi:UDP-glucose 4-epimerase
VRALVTGGAGFIGSALTDALVAGGHDVTVVDDLSRGRREQVNSAARLVQLDVAAPELERIFTELAPEVVFHHAAQIDVRQSVRDPLLDARSNVLGTINVLRSAVICGSRRVVFAGSGGAMYGDSDVVPTPEDHAAEPESPYGAAKVAGEVYGRMFSRMHGIDFVALRYANVYGPRQDPHGEAGVVAIFTQRLLNGEVAVINGDGRQTRDYVYVDDVVTANLRAAEHEGSSAFNIGTAQETDVNRLYRLLSEVTGVDAPARHGDAKTGEQRRSCLAIERAERSLGWRPSVSLDEGLRRTVAYFRSIG